MLPEEKSSRQPAPEIRSCRCFFRRRYKENVLNRSWYFEFRLKNVAQERLCSFTFGARVISLRSLKFLETCNLALHRFRRF